MGSRTGEGLESWVEAVLRTGYGRSYQAEIPVRSVSLYLESLTDDLIACVANLDKLAKPPLAK